MAKRFRTLLVAVLVLGALGSGTVSGRQDVHARIRAASGILLGPPNPSITPAAIVNSLVDLLDVTVSLSSPSQYGSDIKQRIDVAKDLLQKTSMFNEKARQYLSFAHRMLTGGRRYERPADLDQFVTMEEAQEKARKYCRRLVDAALAALDRGDRTEAAKLLLQLVLAVVTPVSGAPADARPVVVSVRSWKIPIE